MNLNNQKGFSLAVVMFVLVILLALSSIFVLRAVHESNMARIERNSTESFYIAEAGANDGLENLDVLINTDLFNTIQTTNPQKISTQAEKYVAQGNGLEFLVEFTKRNNIPQFVLNADGDEAVYTQSTLNLGDGEFQYLIIVTEKGDPVEITEDLWDFSFYYRVESTGSVDSNARDVLISGDFTVRVQRDNFAKFALFTDHHRNKNGDSVWFTDDTHFYGTIHTNQNFSFAGNPSGTFDELVTQHETKAQFYNEGSSIILDADANGLWDVPSFNAEFERGYEELVLPSAVQKKDLADQATGGQVINGNGIFVPNDGINLSGGIFARGNPSIVMSVDVNDRAVYTITEGGVTKIIQVDSVNNQTTVSQQGVGDQIYSGLPDGVDDVGTIIYVDGTVEGLSGTVQKDTEVTISSEFDIVINDNIRYENYSPGIGNPGEPGYVTPNATGTTNLLGILSWGGDVRVASSAPSDIKVHGIVMARSGVFAADEFDTIGLKGTATLLGGAITQFYGEFGAYNPDDMAELLSGYGQNFVYDSRTKFGKAPPYFPSLKTFIAFTNDLTDKLVWQEG